MQYRPSIEDIGRGIYIQQCLHLSHTSDFTNVENGHAVGEYLRSVYTS